MKEQLDGLQSFEPGERARAGQELVAADLDRSADALLDHVANEFDDRVVTAIARAVVDTPVQAKESRRVGKIREWAESELDRLALEEAFLGRDPEPVELGASLPVEARVDLDAPVDLGTPSVAPEPPAVPPVAPVAVPGPPVTVPEPPVTVSEPPAIAVEPAVAVPEPPPAPLPYISWRAPRDGADTADAPATPPPFDWSATQSA